MAEIMSPGAAKGLSLPTLTLGMLFVCCPGFLQALLCTGMAPDPVSTSVCLASLMDSQRSIANTVVEHVVSERV